MRKSIVPSQIPFNWSSHFIIDTRLTDIMYEWFLSERSLLTVLVSCPMTLSPFSNVYRRRLQGSYAGASGFQTRILQVKEMSSTGENDGSINVC